MAVNFTLPEYNNACKKWVLIRAIVDNDAKHLIKDVDPNDKVRSDKYRAHGVLTNFTALTKNGLQGLVFLRDPEVALPPELNYLIEDATGSGLSLTQFAQQICGELLETGRYGVLVDFPRADNLSQEEVESGQFVARFLPYAAEAIINWRTERVNGKIQLVQVVLKECIEKVLPDGFEIERIDQYRVLKLEDGVYRQEIYNEKLEPQDLIVPADYNGLPLNYIPFVIMGAENNDACIDNSPLYDLSVLNLAMYHNSCDYEESIFICGQPTVVINVGDLPADQWKELNGGKFRYGSRSGHVVGLGGNAILLQANPNQLAAQAMKDKIEQATLQGARFITGSNTRETAEGARIRYSSQNSALYILTKNESRGIEALAKMACDFVKGANPDDIKFNLNDKYYEDGADPQLIAQAMLMLDRGALSIQELRDYVADPDKGLIINPDSKEGLEVAQVPELAGQTDPTAN